MKLPHRITFPKEGLSWVPRSQEGFPNSLRKYNNIQAIKSAIHREAHHELINCVYVLVLLKYSITFVIIYNAFLSVYIN